MQGIRPASTSASPQRGVFCTSASRGADWRPLHMEWAIARIGLVLLGVIMLAGVLSGTAQAMPAAAPLAGAHSGPEVIIEGFSPTGFARNDTHLFIAGGGFGLETCGFDPSQSAVILRRVNMDGSGAVPLISGCHSGIGAMVADGDYVYFRDSDNTLKRVPVGGGAIEVLRTDVNTCCGLARDATHLYWAARESGSTNNGIFRMPLAGGALEQIASIPNGENIYLIRAVALDDTDVYWVEGRKGNSVIDQPGAGAVKKVAKTGGAVTTLANIADGVEHPNYVAVDGSHVYWSEWEVGRVRRVAKAGGAVANVGDIVPTMRAHALAVNDQHVYWMESDVAYAGRLRRSGLAGGAITDMAIAILGPGAVILSDSHVYWAQHGGVYRLSLGAGEVAVDFSIDAVEVAQTVQDTTNSVPLVAEKHALVRVYPRVDIYTGQIPKVQLRGYRNGMELDYSPLPPINPQVVPFTSGANTLNLNQTYNFKLPVHWREGVVTLVAEINYDGAINEIEQSNNAHTVVANFNFKKPLCVEMVRVFTAGHTASVSDPWFGDMVDWLQAAYPVPTILIDPGGMIKKLNGSAYSFPHDTHRALARIDWYRLWHTHNQYQKCGQAHFFGMVHPNAQTAGGIGYRPGWAAWGVMAVHSWNMTITQNAPWYGPHGGGTLAHEIAHNKGRKHVDCGGPDDTDGAYPYHPCNMGNAFAGSHVGYHYFKETVIGPAEAGDLMSYAMMVDKPRWISDYTYKAIFDTIPDDTGAAAAMFEPSGAMDAAEVASDQLAEDLINADAVLLISAIVTPTAQTGMFEQVYRVPAGVIPDETLIDTAAATVLNPVGDWTLQLLDAAEAVLAEYRFDLPDADSPSDMEVDEQSFQLAVPFEDGTTRVVVKQEDVEVLSRSASPNAPRVRVLEPNGGESYAGSMTVRWEAEDADGDPLRFLVQYSPDGVTWRVVEVETDTLVLDVLDTGHLPGTKGFTGHVRVFANDGFHSASDRSDAPFSLRMNPPHARIQNPEDGEVVPWGQTLRLVGEAFDVEDGQVAGSGFSWRMDGNLIGSGRELDVNGLAVGAHTVELSVVDSGKMFDTVAHTFYVQKQYCEDGHRNLELAFVVDNSNAMAPYGEAFCQALPGMIEDLEAMGINVSYAVYGVADAADGGLAFSCAPTTVANRWRTDIDHGGDWGEAVATVAANHPWQEDHSRVIVPVINQGPADGNPVHDPGADRDALDDAIGAANVAGAAVSPLLMPTANTMYYAANLQMAGEIAQETNGVVMQFDDPELDFAVAVQDVQAQQSCTPSVVSIDPVVNDGAQEICRAGANLVPGTTVAVGGQRTPGATVNADGTLICFLPPHGLEPGEHAVEIGRPGLSSVGEPFTLVLERDSTDPEPDPDVDPEPAPGESYSIFLPVMER